MTTYIENEGVCPVCAGNVTIKSLTSTNMMGSYTDFHEITMGLSPLLVTMNTCRACGFSGFDSNFEPEKPLSLEFKQSVLSHIQPIIHDVPLDGSRRYELYARIQALNGANAWQMGNHYLRAAWAAAETGSPFEPDYRRQALQFFQKALEENRVPAENTAAITYLIGELYRRIGESEAAAAWFNRVIAQAKHNPGWQSFAEIAQRQRDTPQNKF